MSRSPADSASIVKESPFSIANLDTLNSHSAFQQTLTDESVETVPVQVPLRDDGAKVEVEQAAK